MNLTTANRVRDLLDAGKPDQDHVLDRFIAAVSAAAETYMGRLAEETARTEYHDVPVGRSRIFLRAFPVVSVASLYNDALRTYDSGSLVAADDYYVEADTGIVTMDYELVYGPGAVKVTYTGGLGTDVDDVIANGFGSIVLAVETQVVHLFKRRASPHLAGFTDPAGGASFGGSVDWIPMAKTLLDPYRVSHGR